MQEKRFQTRDEGFVCAHCGATVPPNKVTSRDHCPVCLWSRHVDINPGDRANPCGGMLRPVGSEPNAKKGFLIHYRCEKCGATLRNKAALTGESPDDVDKLIALTAGSC